VGRVCLELGGGKMAWMQEADMARDRRSSGVVMGIESQKSLMRLARVYFGQMDNRRYEVRG
jgi:hypothetical protein